MPRRKPMHPGDRKRVEKPLEAVEGGTLRLRAGKSGRIAMLVRGRSIGTIAADLAESIGLSSGIEWSPSLALRVARALEEDAAQQAAARLLAVRERGSGELLDRLARRGVKPERARRIVAGLQDKLEVNDERFATMLARSVVSKKPAGERLIRAKLKATKVDRATAERAAREALAGRDPIDDATTLARARLRTMSTLDARAKARRLFGLLARRGFDETVCRAVIESLLPASGDD